MSHTRNASAALTMFLFATTIAASVLTGFRAGINPVTPGLDPSFSFAFNYAAVHGERWGRDFISNRGPYGWVLYPVDVGDVASSWFVFQAFFVLMVGTAAAAYVQDEEAIPAIGRVLLGLSLTYIIHIAFLDEWRWFVLFLLVLLLGCHRKDGYAFLCVWPSEHSWGLSSAHEIDDRPRCSHNAGRGIPGRVEETGRLGSPHVGWWGRHPRSARRLGWPLRLYERWCC